jgi:1,4-alpha-glucan branching enzyme
LHELDCDVAGFEWVVMHDAGRSVFVWLRKGRSTQDRCLIVVNFTPEVYRDYRVRVPFSGRWREVLNTDSQRYGGANIGNGGTVKTLDEGAIPEVSLVVPPLAAIFLVPER